MLNILIIAAVVLVVGAALFKIYRDRRKSTTTGCSGCAGCPMSDKCGH